MGPECASTLSRIAKRAAGWHEGLIREVRQEECRLRVGVALMRQIWELLAAKSLL